MTTSVRPDLRFLFSHPAHFVACGLGSGLSRFAPGTAGTLFSWAVYSLIRPNFDEIGFLVFLLVCFVGGVLACHRTGRDLGVVDHGSIVWAVMAPAAIHGVHQIAEASHKPQSASPDGPAREPDRNEYKAQEQHRYAEHPEPGEAAAWRG